MARSMGIMKLAVVVGSFISRGKLWPACGSGSDIQLESEPAPPEEGEEGEEAANRAGANGRVESLSWWSHGGPAARPARTRNPP